jgi:hypothetical protein
MRRRPAVLLVLALLALAAGAGPHPCAPAPPQAASAGSCHGDDPGAARVGSGDAPGSDACCALDGGGACAAGCGMPSWLALRHLAPSFSEGHLAPLAPTSGPRGFAAPRDHVPLA